VGTSVVNTGIEVGTSVVNKGIEVGTGVVNTGIDVGTSVVNKGIEVGTGVVNVGKTVVTGTGTVIKGASMVAIESGGGTAMSLINRGLQYGLGNDFTIVGRMQNDPAYQAAINSNKAELHALYTNTVGSDATQQGVKDALNALDGALGNGQGVTRGDDQMTMSQQDFHSALLKGAHFVKSDGGTLYDQMKTLPGFAQRTSSHYTGVQGTHPNFGMDLPNGMGHLLIGKTSGGDTFFQLESHGTGGGAQSLREKLGDFAGHTQAYLQHIGGGSSYVQVGPKGCIEASEKDNKHFTVP
jgi:hypothetical protein